MNNTTILIVEDDKTIQNFLKVTLKTQNYNYITVSYTHLDVYKRQVLLDQQCHIQRPS